MAAKAWWLLAGSWWPVLAGDDLILKSAVFLNRVFKKTEQGIHLVVPFWGPEYGPVLGTTRIVYSENGVQKAVHFLGPFFETFSNVFVLFLKSGGNGGGGGGGRQTCGFHVGPQEGRWQ